MKHGAAIDGAQAVDNNKQTASRGSRSGEVGRVVGCDVALYKCLRAMAGTAQ